MFTSRCGQHNDHYTVCTYVDMFVKHLWLFVHRSNYPPKITADAMNEWYEQILELSKKIGEVFNSLFLIYFQMQIVY